MSERIGSDFDDFLREDGTQEEVIAAARMRTSRMVVSRLLDENDTSVTLATVARASVAADIPLRIEMV